MNDLVIARYNEPLEWVQLVPPDWHIHVYNKGEPIASGPVQSRARVIERRNVGRESEFVPDPHARTRTGAWRLHRVLPGRPVRAQSRLSRITGRDGRVAADPAAVLVLEGRRQCAATGIAAANSVSSGLRVRAELFSLATWNPVEFIDVGAARTGHAYRTVCGLPEGSNLASHFFASCGLRSLADSAARHLVGRFAYGAIFAVDNQLIAELPPAALRRMRDAALGPTCYGYIIERIWLHLFGEPFALPAFHDSPLAARRLAELAVPIPELAKL